MPPEPAPKQAAPEVPPPPPPEEFYAAKTVLKLSSYEVGSPKLTVLKQFAVGQRVPQVLFCKASKSPIVGDGVFKVYFFDPRYVRKQNLIPIGLGSSSRSSLPVADVVESTVIPYVAPEVENEYVKSLWEADRATRLVPDKTVIWYTSSAHAQVDRRALAKLPLETPAQHCQRKFDDYVSAAERFFDNGSPAKGSSNISFTLPSAGKPSRTLTLPVLFLGDPVPSRLIPSPITSDLLRELTPDRLEIIKSEILQVVEDAAWNKVYFSNLRFEQFGYVKNDRGIPVMTGLVDLGRVYFKLDEENFEWYLRSSKTSLEEEMMRICAR